MQFLRTWQWPIIMALLRLAGGVAALRSAGTQLCRSRRCSTGSRIVSAAFLLTWTAEAAERDVPRTLALAGLALIAVLPEYAVDMLFAWKAGEDPSYAAYATANMTGGNRLLVGVGWTMVVAHLRVPHEAERPQAREQSTGTKSASSGSRRSTRSSSRCVAASRCSMRRFSSACSACTSTWRRAVRSKRSRRSSALPSTSPTCPTSSAASC